MFDLIDRITPSIRHIMQHTTVSPPTAVAATSIVSPPSATKPTKPPTASSSTPSTTTCASVGPVFHASTNDSDESIRWNRQYTLDFDPPFNAGHETSGHRALTDEQELRLVKAIDDLEVDGELVDVSRVQMIAHGLFPSNSAAFGRDFVAGFLHRHSLSLKVPPKRSAAPPHSAQAIAESIAVSFDNCRTSSAALKAGTKRVFINIDESGIRRNARRTRIVSHRGKPAMPIIRDDEKEFVSMIAACTDGGLMLPPFVIFKIGEQSTAEAWTVDRWDVGQRKALIAFTKSGWIDAVLWQWYLQTLRLMFPPETELFFVFDAYSVHAGFASTDWYVDKGFATLILPAKSTGLMQPLDVSVFGPFKARLYALFAAFRRPLNTIVASQRRSIMLAAIELVFNATTSAEVARGWNESGLMAARAARLASEPIPPTVKHRIGAFECVSTPDKQSIVSTVPQIPAAIAQLPISREGYGSAAQTLTERVRNATAKRSIGSTALRSKQTTRQKLNADALQRYLYRAPTTTTTAPTSTATAVGSTVSVASGGAGVSSTVPSIPASNDAKDCDSCTAYHFAGHPRTVSHQYGPPPSFPVLLPLPPLPPLAPNSVESLKTRHSTRKRKVAHRLAD